MKKLQTLLLLLLLGIKLIAQQELAFEHLGTEEGLLNYSVQCLLKDKQGFLWAGTDDGLFKYDGYQFNAYRPGGKNQISGTVIYDMVEDQQGRLWVCTNQGLNVLQKDQQKFVEIPQVTPYNEELWGQFIRKVAISPQGDILLGLGNGLFKVDTTKMNYQHLMLANQKEARIENIRGMGFDSTGQMWIVSLNHGLFTLDKHKSKLARTHLVPEGIKCFSLAIDAQNNKWLGTDHGLFWVKASGEVKQYKHQNNKPHSLSHNSIWSLCTDNTNGIWAGTDGGGLNYFDKNSERFYPYRHDDQDDFSIGGNAIHALLCTQAGMLWVGTKLAGISYTQRRKKPFKVLRYKNGNKNSLADKGVTSIVQDKQGNIWIGSDGKGITVWNKQKNSFRHYSTANSQLQADAIMHLSQDQTGLIWVSTYLGGLSYFDPSSKTFSTLMPNKDKPNSINFNDIRWTAEPQPGKIWIATNGGGINIYDKQQQHVEFYQSKNGLSSNWTLQIFKDSKGLIWIGTYFGATAYNPQTQTQKVLRNDKKINSLSSNWVYAIAEDNNSNIWLGTSSGLNKYDRQHDTIIRYHTADGLPNDVINGILFDDKNKHLWISTNNGLVRFSPETEELKNFSNRNGIQAQFFHGAFYKAPDGTMYFGGLEGLTYFHPDSVKDNETEITTQLVDLQLNYKSVVPDSLGSPLSKHISNTTKLELSYSQAEVITIEYLGLNLQNAAQTRYQLKLENFHSVWKQVGTERKVTFTNLDPGSYTLNIKAANEDGHWSKNSRKLRLLIHPPFWMTWWFRVGATVLSLLCILALFRWRVARIKAQKVILEKQVKERTAEINLQKEEITAQAENLAKSNKILHEQKGKIEQQNELIRGSINYAKTIQQAMLPDAQQVDKYLKHFVLFLPKDIVSGDFYWWAPPNTKTGRNSIFVAVVDCTGHGVPGAFMSMIGTRLLNEIVRERKIHEPAQILKELHHGVYNELKQKTSENMDGMDVSLCRIDHYASSTPQVIYAGAKRPLLYISKPDKTLKRLKGARKKIGGHQKNWERFAFEQTTLTLQKGDMIYLTSDGYIDQNNAQRKRFGSDRFIQLLEQIAPLPLAEQQTKLYAALNAFQQNEEQRDDISIWGLQL